MFPYDPALLAAVAAAPQTIADVVLILENIQAICEEHLKGRYALEIVDIFLHPHLAEGEQILAAPTLIKALPEPLRRIVGDLSDTERVLLGLDLRKRR